MRYEIKFTNQFKKDLKLAKKQNKDLDRLDQSCWVEMQKVWL